MTVVALSLAGALGALARLLVDGAVRARLGRPTPWGTLLINVSGSALLGVVTGLVLDGGAPPALRLVLGTGFCGGYTTFSTASVETVRLLQERRYGLALVQSGANLTLGLAAAGLGLAA